MPTAKSSTLQVTNNTSPTASKTQKVALSPLTIKGGKTTYEHDPDAFESGDEQEDYIPDERDEEQSGTLSQNGAGTMRNRKRSSEATHANGDTTDTTPTTSISSTKPSTTKKSKRKSPSSGSSSKKVYLAHCWQIYFDTGLSYGNEAAYKNSLLGSRIPQSDIETVTQFWLFWEHLNLHALPHYFNLRMFQSGVEPLWETPRNINGAKWVLSLKHTKVAPNMPQPSPEAELNEKAYRRRSCWTELLMGIIGNIVFTTKDDIVGCIFSGRPHLDRLEIWSGAQLYNDETGEVDHKHAADIEKKIRQVLRLRPQAVIEFHLHRKELTKMDKKSDNAPQPSTPTKSTNSLRLKTTLGISHARQFSDDSDSDIPPPSTPSSAPSTPKTPTSKRNHFEQMAFNNSLMKQQKLHMQEVPLTPSTSSKLAVSKHIYDVSQIAAREERQAAEPQRKELSSSLDEDDMESESMEYQSNLRQYGGKNRARKASACKQLFIKVPETGAQKNEDDSAPAKRYRKNSLRQQQRPKSISVDDSIQDDNVSTGSSSDTSETGVPIKSKSVKKGTKSSTASVADDSSTSKSKSSKKSQRGKKSKKTTKSGSKKAPPQTAWHVLKVIALVLLVSLVALLVKVTFQKHILDILRTVLPKLVSTKSSVNRVLSGYED